MEYSNIGRCNSYPVGFYVVKDIVGAPLNIMEHPALILFFQNYVPASTVREADELLTLDDILDLLPSSGAYIERDELYAWMLQKGYIEEMIAPMKTVWMVKVNRK